MANLKIRYIFAGVAVTIGYLVCYFASEIAGLSFIFMGVVVTDSLINSKKLGKILLIFQILKTVSALTILSIVYFVIPDKVVCELIASPYLMSTLWVFGMVIIVERYLMTKRKMIVIGDSQTKLIENQVIGK
ncbi:MAG: hypothetical protein EHM45_16210 [Desulfobacteraceae bacterium]|nr:MAG: hypothetical protein EHM45_16210 [Desulfobacteraceae bacterium]